MTKSELIRMSISFEFSEKEKELILLLAREGPKTGYDLHLGGQRTREDIEGRQRTAFMSSAQWDAFKEKLGENGQYIIRPIDQISKQIDRRQRYFWLTNLGLIASICLGAKSEEVKRIAVSSGNPLTQFTYFMMDFLSELKQEETRFQVYLILKKNVAYLQKDLQPKEPPKMLYSLLAQAFSRDAEIKRALRRALDKNPEIKKRARSYWQDTKPKIIDALQKSDLNDFLNESD